MRSIKNKKNNKAKILFTGSALILNLHSCDFLKQLSEFAKKSHEANRSSSQSRPLLNQKKPLSDVTDLSSTLETEQGDTNKPNTNCQFGHFYEKKQENTFSNVRDLGHINHSTWVYSSYRDSEYKKDRRDAQDEFIFNSDPDDKVVSSQPSATTPLNNSPKTLQVAPNCDDNQDNNSTEVKNYEKINNTQISKATIYNGPSEESGINSEYEEGNIYDKPYEDEKETEKNPIYKDKEVIDPLKKNKIATDNAKLEYSDYEGSICEEHIYEEIDGFKNNGIAFDSSELQAKNAKLEYSDYEGSICEEHIYEEIDGFKNNGIAFDSSELQAKLDNNNNQIGVTITKNGIAVTEL